MIDLSLELIQILDAIDRRGSFAAAADELNKVPSALSYTIQKFEDGLNFSIFVRQGRKSVFTPAGRLLLEQGRELLLLAGRVADNAQTVAMGFEPRLKIAIDSLVPIDGVMQVVAGFLDDHPNMEVDVCEEVLGGAWESLLEDRVQLVIGAPDPKPRVAGLRAELLGEVERVFAVSPGHPLAGHKGPLSREMLALSRMVIVHDSSRSSVPRDTRLLNDGRHFYVQNLAQKIAAQKAGIGVGFLPLPLIEKELSSGALIPLHISEVDTIDRLYLAWKSTNRGQGLKKMASLLMQASLLTAT